MTDSLAAARFRKSTLSGDDGGNCVEVASLEGGNMAVRDTKDRKGGTLVFGSAGWAAFIGRIKAGAYDV
ncbi:DUF397 domain-containing protein [Streptosporangium sp. NPDC020072]|uniref:DUF397 domain-containing protein n=1 Tax=Streptosporangium sp. NPDC020072 TaxID=3154788 RepID=UPI00342D07ED